MPIADQNPINSYTGNGSATTFAYTFKIMSSADLKVTVDGVLKTITTDYTVDGVGNSGGGNVVFNAAPANAAKVDIYRALPYNRETDYVEGGDLRADTVDNDLDRIVMMTQQLSRDSKRAIKMPVGETTDQLINLTAAQRANKLLTFDASGNPQATQEIGVWKGNWATTTAYIVRDIVKLASNGNLYICIVAHTSGTFATDLAAAKWALIVDQEAVTASEIAAVASAAAALVSEGNASTSASTATTQAGIATTQAGNAATSASNASTSASNALTSEGNAATSESNASNSAIAAAASESAAAISESNALTSESNASTSETNAGLSAAAALISEGNASASASTATTQAGIATTQAGNASTSASNAGTSETNAALSAAKLTGTSASSVEIGTGSQSFTTQASKFFNAGNNVMIVSDADPTNNWMHGQVTSYTGTSLVVDVGTIGGSGTHADWTIRVSGVKGAAAAFTSASETAEGIIELATSAEVIIGADTTRAVTPAGLTAKLDTLADPLCTPLAWQNSVNLKAVYASATTATVSADVISMPLALVPTGSNLVTNGADWTGASGATPPTGWTHTTGNGTFTITGSGHSGNYLAIANGNDAGGMRIHQAVTVTAGKMYKFSFRYKDGTAGGQTFYLSSSGSHSGDYDAQILSNANWQLYTKTFIATTTTVDIQFRTVGVTNGQVSNFDTVELYEVTSTGEAKRFTNLSATANIAATVGTATGLDDGLEVVSKWYHIFAIGKTDGTTSVLLSTDDKSPTMPAGYTYASYVGAVYNNSSGDFNAFKQTGNLVTSDNNVGGAVVGGTSATWADLTITAIIPTTASSVTLWLQAEVASGTTCACYVSGVTGGSTGYVGAVTTGATGTLKTVSTAEIPISTPQHIYYYKVGDSATIYVTGWRY